ncbi:hypothetical protein BDQ17DRAFT_1267859 [Cyathus striatus]|nr:hypothetical protein BDQ17DRAFT_1267859 [Cyathus striatus]
MVPAEIKITSQLKVERLIDHPLGTILEYPDTASSHYGNVAHRFTVNPHSKYHPRGNIQYSLGGIHGGEKNKFCGDLLLGADGKKVLCKKEKTSCKGLKRCQYFSNGATNIQRNSKPTLEETVFKKTLAFFCAVVETGCSFDSSNLHIDYGGDSDSDYDSDDEDSTLCSGKMILAYNRYNQPRLQCEYRSQVDTAHLILRNLQEFNISYLSALLSKDINEIHSHEANAFRNGYGPLVPCTFQASPSEQKDQCSFWHRSQEGKLHRGALRLKLDCEVSYVIYTPYNLFACPQVVIISRSIHSHAPPPRIKTPPPIEDIFTSMLIKLGWKLADATPRKIMTESGFMDSLREYLGHDSPVDPPLSALHPSLGNYDHVRRIINSLRKVEYPCGTGFLGAELLAQKHADLPKDMQYVRCAESHTIEGGKTFYLVICMSKTMAFSLIRAQYISIDTAFKRVHGKWQEFEIETWDSEGMMSYVGARAFTTSQSAKAHFILFTRIFQFVTQITGLPVQFRHIHGSGFHVWSADAHKGQALGAGMYCQQLCRDLVGVCPIEPTKMLKNLDPYDHLCRFYRLCVVHFKRNIHDLCTRVTSDVYNAMLSLSSVNEHNIDSVYEFIKNGGPKARAWIKDKLDAKFVIPAIHQPASLIPLPVWQASSSTTNGNEQAHRNINRDGINLTLLGGIMRGMQYDFRIQSSLTLQSTEGVYVHDQLSTEFYCSMTSVSHHVLSQCRIEKQSPRKSPQKKKKFSCKQLSIIPMAQLSSGSNSTASSILPLDVFGGTGEMLQSSGIDS